MKKSLKLAAAGLLAALTLSLVPQVRVFATSLAGQTVGNPLAQDASPTVKNLTVTGNLGVTGTTTLTGNIAAPFPAVQTLAAAFQINADACGGLKLVTSAAPVTSSTTTPFPLAAAANAGCQMDIHNISANTITIKTVASQFRTVGSADVLLTSSETIRVASTGQSWVQTGGAMWTTY